MELLGGLSLRVSVQVTQKQPLAQGKQNNLTHIIIISVTAANNSIDHEADCASQADSSSMPLIPQPVSDAVAKIQDAAAPYVKVRSA